MVCHVGQIYYKAIVKISQSLKSSAQEFQVLKKNGNTQPGSNMNAREMWKATCQSDCGNAQVMENSQYMMMCKHDSSYDRLKSGSVGVEELKEMSVLFSEVGSSLEQDLRVYTGFWIDH